MRTRNRQEHKATSKAKANIHRCIECMGICWGMGVRCDAMRTGREVNAPRQCGRQPLHPLPRHAAGPQTGAPARGAIPGRLRAPWPPAGRWLQPVRACMLQCMGNMAVQRHTRLESHEADPCASSWREPLSATHALATCALQGVQVPGARGGCQAAGQQTGAPVQKRASISSYPNISPSICMFHVHQKLMIHMPEACAPAVRQPQPRRCLLPVAAPV